MSTKHCNLWAIGFCALLLACSEQGTGGNPIAQAKSNLAKNDLKAADIALKSALQADPNSAEARFLKGQLLYRQNAFGAAANEWIKARDLKYPADEVLPKLARAYLADGQYKKVLADNQSVNLGQPEAQADLLTSMASAVAMQGDAKGAEGYLERALQLQPTFGPALLAQARLRASSGQVDAALEMADAVIKQTPSSAEAWQFKGDLLLHGKQQPDAAVEAYRKAIELRPDGLRAHTAAVTALLLARKTDEAAKQFEQLKAAFPDNAQTAFFAAQFAMLRGDLKLARELFAKLLTLGPENVRLLTLAGTNELQLGALVQAETYLGKALKLAPEQGQIRRQLAQVYVRLGSPNKALEVLKPLLSRPDSDDVEALYLAGLAGLQTGDGAGSDSAFRRAQKAAPDDPRVGTALALRKLGAGDADGAFSTLAAIATRDKGEMADLALIGMRMRRREFDAAMAAVDALDKKLPGQALVADMRGRVLQAKRDLPGARASFERALTLTPSYFPAAGRLAALDLSEGKQEQARQRIEAFLKVDPKQNDALMALADLKFRMGGTVDEVANLYREAQRANPTEKGPRMALIEFLLERQSVSKALVAAQEALVALPNDVDVLDALGRAQLLNGQAEQAISTFGRLVSLQSELPQPLVRLAGAYVVRGDFPAAAQRFKRALDIAPGFLPAQQGLIQLALREGKQDVALGIARSIQQQSPSASLGYVLEGDINRLRKNWAGARGAYQAGIKKVSEPTYLATKLHGSYLAEGRKAEGERYADSWLRDHPNDSAFVFHLGMVALHDKDYDTAERRFREVVGKQPANAAALNNLGWVLAELRKPGGKEFVDQALKKAPDNAEFLDTRAHVLALAGDLKGAAESQRLAADAMPLNSAYRFKLVDYKIRAGDKDGAKVLLQEMAAGEAAGADRVKAQRQLDGL